MHINVAALASKPLDEHSQIIFSLQFNQNFNSSN